MTQIDLLDHGYVKLIETWGSDERIIESARMSTDGAFRGWGAKCTRCGLHEAALISSDYCGAVKDRVEFHEWVAGDEKLLRYLYKNKHFTPFEMAGLTIEVQAPIFVFRQWHRHRTQSYNELSARYTTLPDMFYVPTVERIIESSKKSANKQASGSGSLFSQYEAERLRASMALQYGRARGTYEGLIASGVAPELARCVLPVAQYSRMRASANLRNWLAFESLRLDPHSQYEIRVYAEALGTMIAGAFPRTWSLFAEGLK